MTVAAPLGKLVRIPLREAWKHETNDFTPWLAEPANLEELARTLGLSELVPTGTEHPVGDFQLDILCSDGEGKVVIENQLEQTDHDHLGKTLVYAAGVGAKKVVWIAESFRPEHEAALRFLNESTVEEFAFFGVQVELWRIGESPLAPKFDVVVKPNNWTRSGRDQARATTDASPTKQMQLRFWTALIADLKVKAPQIRPHAPRPQHWLSSAIGRANFGLNMIANSTKERMGVELWITGPDAKAHFANLRAIQTELETKLGFGLDWQGLPGSEACRIATWLPDAPLDAEARWPDYFAWFAARLTRMNEVFRPAVKDLP
jgi:hypothetical protein